MEMIKKIGIRIFLLLIIVAISNLIYINTTYKMDVSKDSNVIQKFERAVEKADVLFFSASPNAAVEQFDADQRTLAQMMDDLLAGQKVEAVDTGGIHAGVFKNLIKIISSESKVKTVVVEMNYRSFGADWIYSKLENAIQKQMVFYNNRPKVINRFLQGLNYYTSVSDKEREASIEYHWQNDSLPFAPPRSFVKTWCDVEKWGDWTHPKRQLADAYIKNFAFVLNEKNPRVRDFDEIVEICKEKKLQLVFVILPENLEECEKLVDKDLVNLMKSNKDWLVNRYTERGATVVDCFDNVADSCFTERYFPSEHYNEIGRLIVASAVANAINQ
jgi:hypothetical protein